MAAQDSVTAKLAGAKKALRNAENFTSSVNRQAGLPINAHKDAPYHLAQQEQKKPEAPPNQEIESAAKGLEERRKNVDEYLNAPH